MSEVGLSAISGGVYRVLTGEGDVAVALRAMGWNRVGTLAGGQDKQAVLAGLGDALDFPSWYGRNLDAAWDCLGDLTEPTALVWQDWQDLAVGDPAAWAAVLGVLRDRADEDPTFALVLV